MQLTARGVLLDIEGTTSSIEFVYQEMFPFVRRELGGFLAAHWDMADVQAACQLIAEESSLHGQIDPETIGAAVNQSMDADAKSTGLKQLQGLIWKRGFESGELRAHLFADVAPALRSWHDARLSIRIYSSGSIGAQKLFFSHTVAGDLLPLIDGHYDTTAGPKHEAASYRAITADWELPADAILFLSDVPAELDAAKSAGMQTALTIRPGNAEVEPNIDHPTIESFDQLLL